jgi:hypothetical protein
MLSVDSPVGAVQSALQRVVAHDLAGASLSVCAGRRDPSTFPFIIAGIFQPIGAMPDSNVPRNLAIIRLDVSRLSVTESSRDGDSAEVHVEGILVERFDPVEVEALFRTFAAEQGVPVDDGLLRDTLARVSRGDVELPVDELVPVVREAGTWKVCPPAPTP